MKMLLKYIRRIYSLKLHIYGTRGDPYNIKLTILLLAENACFARVLPLRGRQLRGARIPAMIGARAERRRREVREYFVGRHHVQQASRCGGTCVRAASESSVFDRYRWRPIRVHRCT